MEQHRPKAVGDSVDGSMNRVELSEADASKIQERLAELKSALERL